MLPLLPFFAFILLETVNKKKKIKYIFLLCQCMKILWLKLTSHYEFGKEN